MNPVGEVLLAVVMVVGLAGVVVPVLPGLVVIAGAALVWALEVARWPGWVVFTVIVAVLASGTWLKYRFPGREMTEAQVAPLSWVLAVVGAVVGFFVIPVVGLVLGFVGGTYLGEWRARGDRERARRATVRLVRGIGKGIAIEFTAGLVAIGVFVVAAWNM